MHTHARARTHTHTRQSGILRLLVGAGAAVDARNEFEQTALHLAAMFLKDEAAETLLALGADAAARDHEGRTPADWAGQWAELRDSAWSRWVDRAGAAAMRDWLRAHESGPMVM